ncbi:uncharacterized protein PHALS_04509 [Plasmopara halstedii]|uniref:Uncharacterized protein n=1 Tax=Plasmopara halstedii TaxID=4781 RepID=A0A0P1A9X9_PLAHL|nr:uncharacterized protein PHALS_04509 [Plasmopara halstedii]CEG37046.1 hypothetical protein PHALS_04509 [Plasmopara halstedii]|eukprot:XP_024573415.1 hypothetical protein PHALS_04509 [Plasmopara halstedii]
MNASFSQTQTFTVRRVCSDTLRSLADTKDTLIMVCIGLLEALDRLQDRLHLSTSVVKELKRRLAKMVTRSAVRPKSKCSNDEELGDAVARSCLRDAAKPEEVRGVVHWVLTVTTSLQKLVVKTSLRMCHGIFVLIMSLPGVSTACSFIYGLLQAMEDTLRLSSDEIMEAASTCGSGPGSGRSRSHHHLHHRHYSNTESYVVDPSLTAVVLEYKEKESMVPSNIDQRIRRVMHFQIPLHSFEATVRLPPDNLQGSAPWRRSTSDANVCSGCQIQSQEETKLSLAQLSSVTPRSIPVSPMARKRVQLAFSNFSDDVLYQARDRLRQERAATLTGDRSLRVPRFNVHDCHEDIYLSCGRHCAFKVGTGMYRSVRASVPLQKNRFVYFEMTLQQGWAPIRGPNMSLSKREVSSQMTRGSTSLLGGASSAIAGNLTDLAENDVSVCIGLSTRLMPLNTLVGASKNSIGFYSAGHVLVGSDGRRSVEVSRKYGSQSTVGVLAQVVCHQEDEPFITATTSVSGPSASSSRVRSGHVGSPIGEALVRFTVDGIALRDSNNRVMKFTLPFPSRSELYPTLTLHSQDLNVFSQMSAPDITCLDLRELDLPGEETVDIWCLDGMQCGPAA